MTINAFQVNDDATGDKEASVAEATAALDVATTSLNGTMSSGDKTKLDDIVGQANSNDAVADRYYKMEANGTQGAFGLGSLIGETVPDIDITNLRTGTYRTTGGSTGTFPAGSQTGALQMVAQANNFGYQIFSNSATALYYRRLIAGAWSPWLEIIGGVDSLNIDAGTGVLTLAQASGVNTTVDLSDLWYRRTNGAAINPASVAEGTIWNNTATNILSINVLDAGGDQVWEQI